MGKTTGNEESTKIRCMTEVLYTINIIIKIDLYAISVKINSL